MITVALIWGSYLKSQSDALAQAEAAGEWSLDEETATPVIHVTPPALRAGYASPGGNLRRAEDASYGGVTLRLGACTKALPYTLNASKELDLSYASDAPSLASHVATLKSKGLYVIGVFEVTSFNTADTATRTYRKGLEMTLLSLFASAGVNDILLTGLPAGSDDADALAVAYLKEVKELWATMPVSSPALGVALSHGVFQSDVNQEDGSPIYAGELTPGRMLKVCDYLALDLRGEGVGTHDILYGMQYAYVRYSLRLLMPLSETSLITTTSGRGFGRILEYGG